MSSRRPVRLIISGSINGNLFKRSESGSRLACLCNRDGSPDKRTDAGRNSHQTFIEQSDFVPIDASSFRSTGVNRLNRSFQLIAPHVLESSSRPQMFFGFLNHRLRPKSCVLLIQRHKLTIVCVTSFSSRFTVQYECKQTES